MNFHADLPGDFALHMAGLCVVSAVPLLHKKSSTTRARFKAILIASDFTGLKGSVLEFLKTRMLEIIQTPRRPPEEK